MRSRVNIYLRLSGGLFICFIVLLFLPAFALSQEEGTYVFERMWPELQQPWYFEWPDGIAADKNGNIYIVDRLNNRIQKFSPNGEFITKWGSSGSGDGQFIEPSGISIDGSGNVYVVDLDYRIQKFNADGEFILKWGSNGTGDGQFGVSGSWEVWFERGPMGIAIDEEDNIYVSDTGNCRIQKFTTEGEFVSKWGTRGSGNGQFLYPTGIAFDSSSNIYVSDTGNYRIQKFNAEGEFISAWGSEGSGNGQFGTNEVFEWGSGPRGIAIDQDNNVYVADPGNNRFQKFDQDGAFISELNTNEKDMNHPFGIALDSFGHLYIADTGGGRILKFDSEERFISIWGSSGKGPGQFNSPKGVARDSSGNVYVVDNHRIQKFNSEGVFITMWGSPGCADGQFNHPAGIALDNEENVYVVDTWNCRIQKFDFNGEFITQWGSEGSGEGEFGLGIHNYSAHGITTDKDGNVFVVDTMNSRIQKFTSDGKFLTMWGTEGSEDGQFETPYDIAADKEGYVYVVEYENPRVQKFDSDGNFITKWNIWNILNEGGGAGYFETIAVDQNGDIFIASEGSGILKFSSDGEFITSFGGFGSEPGQLNGYLYLCISTNGKVYISEESNNRISVFAPEGLVTEPEDPPDEDPETIPKAIIVAGGGPFQGNNLWDATQMCANYAYRALTYQGYTKDSIYYLSADTDLDLDGNGILDDVDGDATNANLESAITTWAQDAEELFIYMVDHGGEGTFRMGATELLYAQDLDSWLDEIQDTIPGSVTLLYDACQSGSFLPLLTPPSGKERIIAASASSNEEALFGSQGTISFSFLFWARMFNGDSFYDSFVNAKNSVGMSYAQTSQIEANGNGVGNEDEDKLIAEALRIGNETLSAGDIPVIGSVSPEQTLEGETSALIYAEDVIDANGISHVWAVITPPGYSPGSLDSPVTDLPVLDLGIVGDNCYEGTYDGFTEEGSYSIAIYASDGYGVISFPMPTEVNQTEGFSAWQLISLSQQPSDTNIDSVLDTISDKVISVWAYIDGSWQVYDPENPGFSDLSTMEAGKGYWLHLSESGTLDISGITPSGSIDLSNGWNLVGYNASTSQAVTDALASIEGKYISVWAYMNEGWKVYDPENPGFSDLATMEPGYGYWINASQGCTWILP